MKQRNHMVTGDSHGANPVVSSEELVTEKGGPGRFLTEDEVLKRAEQVKDRRKGALSQLPDGES